MKISFFNPYFEARRKQEDGHTDTEIKLFRIDRVVPGILLLTGNEDER